MKFTSSLMSKIVCHFVIYELWNKHINIMKKNLLLIGVCASAFLFFACSGTNKNNQPADNGMSVQDANKIIQYYDLSLSALKNLVNVTEINALMGLMEQRGKAPEAPAFTPWVISATDSTALLNPDSCFNEATRQSLKQNYTGLLNARNLFFANYNTYQSYVGAKTYQKDNFAKAAKLLEDNYVLSTKMTEFKQVIFDELSFVTTEAEKVVLADNPLKEQIMVEKKITLSMQIIMNQCAAKKVNEAKVDEQIVVLEKQLEAAKELPAVTGHDNAMKSYQNFLAKADIFLKAIRQMRQNRNYTDVEYNTLNSAYETSIN